MKRRIYTDKFVEKQVAAIDKMNDDVQNSFPEYPNLEDHPHKQKLLIELLKHNRKQSYVAGFWMGYSLAMHIDFDKEQKP